MNNQDQADAERQQREHEQQMWESHYRDVRELEDILTEMGVRHTKIKERKWT